MMQKAILYLEDGQKKNVYLLDENDLKTTDKFRKTNIKEHVYLGFLILGAISFSLGIYLSIKKINNK